MPSRGRRIAARQAQLGQKRKKGRGPSGIPTTPDVDRDDQVLPQTSPVTSTVTEPRPTSTTARRTEARPAVYRYVGSELRRILLLSGVILAVLVALSFVID